MQLPIPPPHTMVSLFTCLLLYLPPDLPASPFTHFSFRLPLTSFALLFFSLSCPLFLAVSLFTPPSSTGCPFSCLLLFLASYSPTSPVRYLPLQLFLYTPSSLVTLLPRHLPTSPPASPALLFTFLPLQQQLPGVHLSPLPQNR